MINTDQDLSTPTENTKGKVQQVLAAARHQTGEAVARSGEYVRERPAVSLGSAFAVGFALGALAVLAAGQKPAPRRSLSAESRDRLAELFGNVAGTVRGPLDRTYSSVSDSASALSDGVVKAFQKVASTQRKCGWW